MSALCQERPWDYVAGDYCAVLPKVISGLRKPIAIQAVISFNISLPE